MRITDLYFKIKHLSFSLGAPLIAGIFSLTSLTGCSGTPSAAGKQAEPNYAILTDLHEGHLKGRFPVIYYQDNLILTKHLTLPPSVHEIHIKYYRDTARPVFQTLAVNAKANRCYRLVYRTESRDYAISEAAACHSAEHL